VSAPNILKMADRPHWPASMGGVVHHLPGHVQQAFGRVMRR
jgi:hypothetical protein